MATKGAKTREHILAEAENLVFARGYSGTSIDDVLKATGLTKGAFFYHFSSKKELARALLERFWERDFGHLRDLAEKAKALGDEPLQTVLIYFKLLEQTAGERTGPGSQKCLFAIYLYEGEQLDEDIHKLIRGGFGEWEEMLISLLAPVFELRSPRLDVTARELAEMAIELLEGGFILSQVNDDTEPLARASRYFRQHLRMLFGD